MHSLHTLRRVPRRRLPGCLVDAPHECPVSSAAYRRSNRERIRERARAYREAHRERLREYNAEYYRNHRHAHARRPSTRIPRDSVLHFGRWEGSEEERIARLHLATLVIRTFVAADLDPSPAAKAYFRDALDEDRALEREFAARTAARLASGLPRLAVRRVANRSGADTNDVAVEHAA